MESKAKKKVVRVHFVCTSNTFRSRLAEVYLRSKKIPNIKVSSSGVTANENPNGPITWYAARLVKKHSLIPFLPQAWTQSTPKLFKEADIIVFMDEKHHLHSKNE